MKPILIFKPLITLFLIVVFAAPCGMSQPVRTGENIYTKWITLALLGKNQSEIEFYFRNEKDASIQQVKERIRFAVLENLRRSGIRSMVSRISDIDDYNVIITKIHLEVRFAGLEHDPDLLLSIKEEFGIELENL